MTKENTRALLLINSIFDVEFCESNNVKYEIRQPNDCSK